MELGLGLLMRCFCQFRSKDRITRFDVDFVTLQTIYMHKKAIRHKKKQHNPATVYKGVYGGTYSSGWR